MDRWKMVSLEGSLMDAWTAGQFWMDGWKVGFQLGKNSNQGVLVLINP